MKTSTKDISWLCALGAIIVAATGNDGWGWLLFAAIILA